MNARKVLSLSIVLAAALAFATVPQAQGGSGDIAIFTETTAGEGLTKAISFDQNWDNEYRNTGSAFSYTLDNTTIDLNEPGHYMAIYNSRFDSPTGTERREIQSQLVLDAGGTPDPLSIGWSQGYIRNDQNQLEAITAGGGIFELSAASTLSLRSTRTDNEDRALTRAPSASGIQLLKLDDSWDYLRLTRAADQPGPTSATWVDVAYDQQDEVDGGSFAHGVGSGDITLKTAGHYMVFANTYNDMTNHDGTRTVVNQRLTLGGSTLIPGTRTTTYMRGNTNTDNCFQGAASIGTIIETIAADQILNVELMLDTGNGTTFKGGKTAITIVKLPDAGDGGEYIRLDDDTGQNINNAAKTPVNWNLEHEETGAFTHDIATNNSRIGVTEDDDYLFLSAMYDDTDETARGYYWQRWEVNGDGSPLEFGQTGQYSRSTQGADAVGNWSGAIVGMTGGQYIESVSQQLGNGGALNVTHLGLQGVRLSTLFGAPLLTWDAPLTGLWSEDAKWLGGTLVGGMEHLVPGGTVTVSANLLFDDRPLELTIDESVSSPSLVTIDSGIVMEVIKNVTVAAGTLDVDGQLIVGSTLDTTGGTLDVAPGELVSVDAKSLIAGGTHTIGALSTIDVTSSLAVDSTLNVTGAALDTAGASVTVSGTGVLTVDAALSAASFDIAGTMNAADVASDSDITLTGGGLNVGANAIYATSGELKVLGGVLTRTGNVNVKDLTLSNGAAHTFASPASLIVTGNTVVDSGSTLTADGILGGANVTVTGASSRIDLSGVPLGVDAINVSGIVTVDAGGTLKVGGRKIVADTLKVLGTGVLDREGGLDDDAGVTVTSLVLSNGATHSFGGADGTLAVNPGGTVEVSGAGTVLTTPATLSVDTLKVLNGGAVVGDVSATVDYFLDGADLDVAVTGVANVTALSNTVNLNEQVNTTGFVTVEAGTTNLNIPTNPAELHTIGGAVTVTGGAMIVNQEVTSTAYLEIDGGDVTLNAPLTTVGLPDYAVNRLDHYGYHTGPNGVMDLNNNSATSMMGGGDPTQGPTFYGQAILTNGPGGRGLDFNNDADFKNTGAVNKNDQYSNLFLGKLHVDPSEAGVWGFRIAANDDNTGIWIDLDQDGVFESSQSGLGDNRGEQLGWDDTTARGATLAAGDYMIAFTHNEGSGGSQIDARFTRPGGSEVVVKPGDAAQDGLWFVGTPSQTKVANGTLTIAVTGALTTGQLAVGAGGAVDVAGALDTAFLSVASGTTVDIQSTATVAHTGGGLFALASGGTINAGAAVGGAGADAISLDISGTYNADAVSSVGQGTVTVRSGGALMVNVDGAATGVGGIAMEPGSMAFFKDAVTQTVFPNVVVPSGAGLGGNVTNAVWVTAAPAAANEVQVEAGSVLAITTGAGPAYGLLGTVFSAGITDPSGAATYTVGDDGVNVYNNLALGPWTTWPANDLLESTVTAVGGAAATNLELNGATVGLTAATTLDIAEVNFTGEGLVRYDAAPGGTGTVIKRTGTTATADNSTNIVEVTGAGGVAVGETLNVINGRVALGVADAIAGDLIVGGGASMSLISWAPSSGNIHVAGLSDPDGPGLVKINNNARFNGGATWTFDDGAMILSDVEDFDIGSANRPANAIWVLDDNGRDDFNAGPTFANGGGFYGAGYQDGDIQNTNGVRATGLAGATTIHFGSASGKTLNLNPKNSGTIDLTITGGAADVSINEAPYSIAGNGSLAHRDTGGTVTFTGALTANDIDLHKGTANFNGNLTANDITVHKGTAGIYGNLSTFNDIEIITGLAVLGNGGSDVINAAGGATVRDGAEIRIRGDLGGTDTTKIRYKVENDLLFPGGIIAVDKGGMVQLMHQSTDTGTVAAPDEIGQSMTFRATGDIPGEGRTMSVFKADENGTDGGNDNHVLFNGLIFEAGAHVGIDRQNQDADEIHLSIELQGDAIIEREPDEFSLRDITSTGGTRTLVVGRDGNGGTIYMSGAIGADVTLHSLDTTFRYDTGAVGSLAPTAVVANLGKETPGYAGSDGYIEIYAGSDGLGNQLTAGTFLLAGDEQIRVRVREVATGNPQVVNTIGTTIRVQDGADARDAQFIAERDNDSNVPGMVVLSNVVLEDAAKILLDSSNGTDYNVLNLDLGNGGVVQLDADMPLNMNTVVGSGRIYNSNGAVTVDTTLSPGASVGLIEFDNAGGFGLLAGATYEWDMEAATTDLVTVTGDLTLETTWRLEVYAAFGTAVDPADTFPLFEYGGALTTAGAGGVLTSVDIVDDAALPAYYNTGAAQVIDDGAGEVYVTGITAFDDAVWTGGSNNWDNGPSWTTGIEPVVYSKATIAEGGSTATVNTAGNIAWRTIVDNNDTLSIETGGQLSVSNRTTVGSTGTLSVTGTGEFNSATLNTAGATSLSGTGTGHIGALNATGGDLTLDTASATFGRISSSAAATNITAQVTATGTVSLAGTVNAGAGISAAGRLTLDGNTVNVTDIADFVTGTGSTSVKNTPDLNISAAGHLIIHGSGGEAPVPVTTGLLAHWDANGIGIADGAQVDSWVNKANPGTYDLTRTGGSPTYVASEPGLNDNAAVLFATTGTDWFEFDDINTIRTVFWVLRDADAHNNEQFLLGDDGSYHFHSDTNGEMFHSTYTHANIKNGSTELNGVVIDGTATMYPTDFSIISVITTGNVEASRLSHDRTYATRSWEGEIAEVLIYNTALSAAEEDLVGGYLAGKYGLEGTAYEPTGGATFGALALTAGSQLTLVGDGDVAGTGAASFESISGAGAINGEVTIVTAASPGGSGAAGTIAVQGDLVVGGGSNTTWEIGDLIDVNTGALAGDVTLEDGATVTIDEGAAPTFGIPYDVIQFEGALTLGQTAAGSFGPVSNVNIADVGAGDWSEANAWYDTDSVFLVASATRTWDGTVGGNWSGANWLPAAPSGPTVLGNMIVNSGSVSVDAPHIEGLGAMSLTIDGGTVVVANALDVSLSTTVNSGNLNVDATMRSGSVSVNGGAAAVSATGALTSTVLDVTDGTVTAATGGAIDASTVNVSGTGSLTSAGDINATTLNSSASLDVTGGNLTAETVNLTGGTAGLGGGALLDITQLNVSGAAVTASADMTNVDMLEISGGTVNSTVANMGSVTVKSGGALNSSAALAVTGDALLDGTTTTSANLAVGGTLSLVGTVNANGTVAISGADINVVGADLNVDGDLTISSAGSITGLEMNQLNFGYYDGFFTTDLDFDNGIDGDGIDGGLLAKAADLYANWPLYFQGLSDAQGIATGPVDVAGDPSDTYSLAWEGVFVPPTTTTYTFYVHGDDHEALWIDTDQDGEFDEATDLISDNRQPTEGWNTPHTETADLIGGVAYRFAIGFTENTGGDFLDFRIDGVDVNPSDPAQDGWWATGGGMPMYGTVSLANASTVDLGVASVINKIATGGATAGITGDVTVRQEISLNSALTGQLDITGDLVLSTGAKITWNGDGDKVSVSGDLDLRNDWTVGLDPPGVVIPDTYDLFDYGSLNAVLNVDGFTIDNVSLTPPPDSPYADLINVGGSSVISDGASKIQLVIDGTDATVWGDVAGAGGEVWATAGNWTNGLPGLTKAAVVDSSVNNTATLASAAETHTLIVDGALALVDVGGFLTVANNTHVMSGGTLTVAADAAADRGLKSDGDTTVYSGGALDVQGQMVLADDMNLDTAGTTTFGAASSLTLSAAAGGGGNLNVTDGTTTLANGASIAVNAINATGGILNVEADLNPGATPLSVDGGTVSSTALTAGAVDVAGGSLTSIGAMSAASLTQTGGTVTAGAASLGSLDLSGGSMTAAGLTAIGNVKVSSLGALSTDANVSGGTVELFGGTVTKTGVGPATISAGAGDVDAAGSNINVTGGELIVNVPSVVDPGPANYDVLIISNVVPGGRVTEQFIQAHLEGRTDATFTVTWKLDTDVFTDDNISGSIEDEKAAFVANFDLLISTNQNAARGIGQYLDADPADGIDVAIPIVTGQYNAYGTGAVGSGLLDFGSAGVDVGDGNTIDIVDGGHPLAGRVSEGTATVYGDSGPTPRRGIVDISPDADIIATATAGDGTVYPVIAGFEVGYNLYDALPGEILDDPPGDGIPPRVALARMVSQWWSISLGDNPAPDGIELFDAAVDWALSRDVQQPWLGDVSLEAGTKLTIGGTGGAADLRSITAVGGTAAVVGAISVFRGLQPGVDVAAEIAVDGALNVEAIATYTWDTLDDVVSTNGALTLEDGWTLVLEEDGAAPVAGTPRTLFEYASLAATLDGVLLSEVNIDATAVPTWGLASDIFVRDNAGASRVELYIAPTLDWDFASQAAGDYELANWLLGAVPAQPMMPLANVGIGGGDVTVTTARTGSDAALSLAVSGGSLTVGALGTLDVIRSADVTGAGTALNVDGTLNVGIDLNIASGGAGGAVSVSATGVASITNNVNVGAAGSLTVTGGELNATTLNTAGTTSLTGATGTIGTINVTGGTTTIASPAITQLNASNDSTVEIEGSGVTNLSVAGTATVNTTAAAGVTDLHMNSGQVNLTGGDLSVATATLNGGVMDASANDLIVSDRVTVGTSLEAEISSGDFVVVSGADLGAGRTMTLTSGTLTMSAAAFPTTGLDALWDFDETTGASAADSSGGHTGTLAGFPVDDSQWVAGKVGGALDFDGADDQVDITGYKGVTGTQARTMAAWVKTTDPNGAILSWGTDATGQKWIFRTQDGDGQAGAIRTEVSGGFTVGATDLRDDAWHHVVMVLPDDGTPNVNEMLVYVDGQLDTPYTTGNATAINTASSLDVRIGNGHSNRRFDGLLDQVGIWARALTADEIAIIYNGGNGMASTALGTINQPETNIVFSGTSTLALDTTSAARLGNVTVAAAQIATIDGSNDLTVSNLTVGSGSTVKSTTTETTEAVTITVDDTLSAGNGNSMLGGVADSFATNLTLAGTSTYEWSFTKADGLDEMWQGDALALFGAGAVEMEDGVTIKLIDGGGSSAGAAGGVDVALFWALGGAAFDPANITVEAPDGKDWTWDTVGGVPGAAPILEFVDAQWVVLRGLVTATHPGDANKDAKVDHEDLILFNAQFGLRGPDQSCDFDLDNDVDLDDFKMLKDEWGWVASAPEPGGAPEPAETPEPATMTLLALGGLLVLRRRRRKA